jgi:ketosteroid isomerase-like protein
MSEEIFVRQVLMAGFLTFVSAASAAPSDVLLAADRGFSALSVEKGAHAAFLAMVTDDVRLYQGDHPPLIGKAAVAAYYAGEERADRSYKDQRLEWTPAEAEISPDGMLGFTRGRWVLTAPAFRLTGYYVTEWRRGSDGTYKVCLDIGGADKAK